MALRAEKGSHCRGVGVGLLMDAVVPFDALTNENTVAIAVATGAGLLVAEGTGIRAIALVALARCCMACEGTGVRGRAKTPAAINRSYGVLR